MAEEEVFVKPSLEYIGRIKTPYHALRDCPRNIDPEGPLCELHIDAEFEQGLIGLAPGRSILVLYWLGDANRKALTQRKRESGQLMGVFALRSPHRPNPIGAAVVPIVDITSRCISVRGLDCLDGTPLLDIKPAILAELAEERGQGPAA